MEKDSGFYPNADRQPITYYKRKVDAILFSQLYLYISYQSNNDQLTK